ncbi:unnamed protein product [Auanema sp. JU1783]|nr:unnamed protein product [Auanema sp. JU1783]
MCREDESDVDIDLEDAPSSSTPMNESMVTELAYSSREDADDIKILIATDIHVGYGETKANRHMDSIRTFEEVLQIAVEKKADMVLLGGDLFHENLPTREMQLQVVQLLRQYCMSDREVSLEFLSDPSVNFNQSRFDRVNYEDGNLNIGLPVFTIHGNHDDMAGKGLTALDLLHEAGLINLFGKFENIDKFELSPILLRKGDTRLALFGMGSQRDDRLCRAFQNESIKFLRPRAGAEDWFNLLVLHQNRPKRSNTRSTGAYLPEQFIPSFFDLVVWGHEHECKKECQYVSSSDALGDGFFILQPGSTIATSLTKDEALPKHVFLAKIRGRKFQCKPIPLQTTRQIICDELILDTVPKGVRLPVGGIRPSGDPFVDEIAVCEKIKELIEKAEKTRGPKQPKLPLIRLKVLYAGAWAGMHPINVRRVGAKFDGQVANAVEMIVTKLVGDKKKKEEKDKHLSNQPTTAVTASNVEEVIFKYFEEQPWEDRLTVLTHGSVGSALEAYAEEEVSAVRANKEFESCISTHVDQIRSKLKQMPVPDIKCWEDIQFERFEKLITGDIMELKKMIYNEDANDESQMEDS